MFDRLSETSTLIRSTGDQAGVSEGNQQPMLVVMHGSLLGMTYTVNSRAITIGRMADLDIPIDDENVSRRHAEIVLEGDCVKLRDLDSTNGTFVNSQRVKESVLCDGDLILIGRVLFKFIRSSSIENRFFGQMYSLATTDFLTGIFNRQHIMSRLESEFARARRYVRPLSVLLYDIDHFKQINDTFGHLAGDQLLIESSRLVSKNVRQQDFFGRLGGDEFLVICPETDLNNTVLMAQRLSQLVEKWSYSYQSRKLDFSISIGIAGISDEMRSSTDLIAKADAMMYKSKHRGRNHVSY
ncbi:MAG: GGDEF domain-containing protein [bacterium]|nr:GGDEF domain-containing protein [bacterium]